MALFGMESQFPASRTSAGLLNNCVEMSRRASPVVLYLAAILLCGLFSSATASAQSQTLFTTQVPTEVHQSDGANVNYELGTSFQSTVAGRITAIRFWKDAGESSSHTGRLWSASGQLLASVTFTNETSSGWQQRSLSSPVAIAANTTYVVSVNTRNTFYVDTDYGLASQVVSGNLRSIVGNNGLYGSVGQFPTNSWHNTNYFRDVVFVPTSSINLTSLTLSATSVRGGTSLTGTVTMSGSTGAVVALSSDNAAATVPSSVTVAAGATTANFPISTSGVGAVTSASITGNYNTTRSATLSVTPPVLIDLSVSPTEVVAGASSTGTVTLDGPAASTGAVVGLSVDNAAAIVPSSVTVAGGETTASFQITTAAVSNSTLAVLTASFNGTDTAGLNIDPVVLTTLGLNPNTVAGGVGSVGTVRLSAPAPAGGVEVTLSGQAPSTAGVLGVYTPTDLPPDGTIDWANVGPAYSSIASGTATPVTGVPGLNLTLSTATGLPMQTFTNCAAGGDCGWYGNFAAGASVLWVSGTYDGETGWWAPNGPLAVTLNSPQRGLGFQIMADEPVAFTATLCAYDSADALLGCVPFNGAGSSADDNSAVFIGLYDDVAAISKVTIDAGGAVYPHDFAIGELFVASNRRPMVPSSVVVPAGATSADFPISTSAVTAATSVTITGTYVTTHSAHLTIDPSVLSTVTLTPASVTGGTSLIGTATLSGSAPAGGIVVTLSADNPVSTGIEAANTVTALPQDGSITWTDLGSPFASIASGTVAPITGLAGSSVTISTANGLAPMILTNCPAVADCGWGGNFVPAAPLLWVGGTYDDNGAWLGNGPFTFTFDTPERGLGFSVMADEAGPFTANVCAYNSADVLLGCVPFNGVGDSVKGNAVYVGLYDDTAEISEVTIDAGGALYPHDFAIGQVFVTTSRRMIPSSVKVQAGARAATFPVNTDSVGAATTVRVTGSYGQSHTGVLQVNP